MDKGIRKLAHKHSGYEVRQAIKHIRREISQLRKKEADPKLKALRVSLELALDAITECVDRHIQEAEEHSGE